MRLVLESGRRVTFHLAGRAPGLVAPDASTDVRVVVFCHCAPGAGPFDPDPARTTARGVRLLSVDRPGYGGSDPLPPGTWPTVGVAANDVAAVVERVGAERVGVVGWSAGGRVALAFAARYPELVDRVVVVGTPAPDDAVGWLSDEQREALASLRGLMPGEALARLRSRLRSPTFDDPFSGDALWLVAALTADVPALRSPGVRARLGAMLRAGFAQGTTGLAADIAGACLAPWGFDPEEVRARTLLVYGTDDPLAGPSHGRWWQRSLPDARLEVAPGGDHLLLVPAWEHVLAHVAPRRARRRVAATTCGDPVEEERSSAA